MPYPAALVPIFDRHGARMQRLGFGTWRLAGQACRENVETALACGYRHIDTAAMYENETEVGAGLRSSGLPRDALFVTTKVWRDNLRRDDLVRSAEASLGRLGCDYIDLLLVHWPNDQIPLRETMAALNAVRERGLTRHIGVSNFSSALLREAASLSMAPILANQCEYHPGLDQSRLIATCRALGIAFTAYRPLGQGQVLDNPIIKEIAARHSKASSQIVLRWHLQQPDIAAIPRSGNPAHIKANLALFDFELSDAEMQAISALGTPEGRHVNPAWAPAWDAAEAGPE